VLVVCERNLLMNVSDISAAASAKASIQVLRHCSIIWKLRHMCTTVQIVRKCLHVSAFCAGTYQHMALSVSMSVLTLLSNFPTLPMSVTFRAGIRWKKWIRIFGYGSIRIFKYLRVCDIIFYITKK